MIEKEITISELKELYDSNKEFEIYTPQGWKKVTDWFNKGELPTVKITTETHLTVCATNHLIAVNTGGQIDFVDAGNIKIGDSIFTETGIEEVKSVEQDIIQECYDFTIDSDEHEYYGDGILSHNSGKSYIASGNVVKDALSQGVTVILIDTEDRLDEQWMRNIGVDPESKLLQRIQTNSIEKTMQIISMVAKDYKDTYKDVPFEEQPGLLFVIDSLGAIYPEDEMTRFSEGDLSMTDGMRSAGAKTKLVNSILSNIASTKMGCLVTNHVYASTDMYSDDVIPGGKKLVFLTTQILQMNKLKLKAKDVEGGFDGAKDSDVVGIRSKCKVYKSNWNKCFESVEVQIPYTTGMNPYSGLFDLFEQQGVLERVGNKYVYKSLATGEEIYNEFRKNYTNEMLDVMMKDFQENYGKKDLAKAVAEVVSEESSDE